MLVISSDHYGAQYDVVILAVHSSFICFFLVIMAIRRHDLTMVNAIRLIHLAFYPEHQLR